MSLNVRLTPRGLFLLIVGGVCALLLGLAVVWMNIERMDTAYRLKALQMELDARQSLAAKLRLERDNLLSPLRLREKAREYGLGPAKPGQLRHMNTQGG